MYSQVYSHINKMHHKFILFLSGHLVQTQEKFKQKINPYLFQRQRVITPDGIPY